MRSGIGYVPNDRALKGLLLIRSVGENLNLVRIAESNSVHVTGRRIEQVSEQGISRFQIKALSHLQEVRFLSGGNQQKVMLAKWLTGKRPIVVMDEPTEGVDVGVRLEIHSLLREMSNDGSAIVLISTDLDQLLILCHRVLIMSRGKLRRSYDLVASSVQKNVILEEALFKV
jgi:ABC-type sugar transport system ATPase subunit